MPLKSPQDVLEALDQLVLAVARAPGSDEAQSLLAQVEESGEGVLGELIAFCLRSNTPEAADFLALCALLANDTDDRKHSAAALDELEGRGVHASSPFVPHLRQKRYMAGFVASAGRGRGHRLLTLWRRERGLVQAYLFGLDAQGALWEFEVSRNLSATQAEELIKSGGVRLGPKEAAGLVRRGLDVARAKGLELPADYLRQHRFIEESIFGT